MDNTELKHHGTKGMRWGVRLYQNKDGSLTAAGKKRYSKELADIKAEKAKIAAQKKIVERQLKTRAKFSKLDDMRDELASQKKELAAKQKSLSSKHRKKELTPEETEAKKQAILKRRSPKEIYENAHLFSDKELSEVYNRMNTEKNIKSLIPKEVKKGEEVVDKIINYSKKAVDGLETGVKLYNNVAKILNAGRKSGDKLPLISGGGDKKKKDDKKK